MTRFTLPALGMFAAIAILFAGAFADLPTWQRNAPAIIARPSDTLTAIGLTAPHDRSQTVTAMAPANAPAPNNPAQPQPRDAHATIAAETRELEALRTSVEEVRRDLATLREEREREQAASARTEAARSVSDSQPVAVTTRPASVASTDFANTMPVAPDQRLLAARRLEAARTALTAGRRSRARWLLSVTRTQMAQWPSAAGQPAAAAAQPPSKGVETAIDLLNRGDREGAVHAIDQVLAFAGADSGNPTRRTD